MHWQQTGCWRKRPVAVGALRCVDAAVLMWPYEGRLPDLLERFHVGTARTLIVQGIAVRSFVQDEFVDIVSAWRGVLQEKVLECFGELCENIVSLGLTSH